MREAFTIDSSAWMPDCEADEASPTQAEMLFFELELPPEEVRAALELPVGVKAIHAARALNTTQGLVTHDELWANREVFERMTKDNLEHHEERMLYAFYQRACGVTITRCEETLKARLMPEAICRRSASCEHARDRSAPHGLHPGREARRIPHPALAHGQVPLQASMSAPAHGVRHAEGPAFAEEMPALLCLPRRG